MVVGGVLGIALLALAGCEEKTTTPSKATVPKAEEQPVIDPNLGKAIAATSAAAAQDVAPATADGPPETGVFTVANADATHAVGKPIHVELGMAGMDPKLVLVPSKDDVPKTMVFNVATMMGARSSLPTVDMTFGLKVDKPKGPKSDELLALPVGAKLTKIVLSSQQPGEIPKEIADEVAKMKDSKMAWTFASGGGIGIDSVERAEKARPELEHNLVAVAETLAAAAISAPSEPVGAGATWIARSRDVYGGLDLISYRMIRVTKVEGETVTYQVETRQYAAGPDMKKPGLPEGGQLVQFESTGAGEFVLQRGKRLADRGTMTHTMKFGLRPPNAAQNQIMPLVLQSTIRYPLGE